MNAAALLAEARAAGIRVTVRGDRLRIEAKPGAVSADMRARLAAGKPAIVEALRDAESTIRAHLLHLAESEGVDAAHVHRLHADDVTACAGQPDKTLRAYLRGLVLGAGMDAGHVPPGWTTTAHCEGCGPVWLWPDAARVRACPWCFRRKAGKPIPRPQVQCRDCRHFLPNAMNPAAGGGDCAAGRAGHWPMQWHRCDAMRPP